LVADPLAKAGSRAVRRAAAEVYVHCFPLLLTDIVRRAYPLALEHFLLVEQRAADLAPGLEDDDDECLLLSSAWIELSGGPVIAYLPPTQGRYFTLTLVDTSGAPFATLGSRTGDDAGAHLALVGPRWEGELPGGLTARRAPSDFVWALSRIYAHSAVDRRRAAELAAQQWLSTFGRTDEAPRKPIAALEIPTPPAMRQLIAIDPETLFHRLDSVIERAPRSWRVTSGVAVAAARARIRGEAPVWDAEHKQAIADGLADGLAAIRAASEALSLEAPTGRRRRVDRERSLVDPLERAAAAYLRLGAAQAEDVRSLAYDRDAEGRLLNGGETYRIRFRNEALPPARAFWRLSTQPAPAPRLRRALGDRSDLVVEPDGAVEIVVQSSPPEPQWLRNWLPSPEGDFRLQLSLYWPAPPALAGGWRMPPIQRVALEPSACAADAPPAPKDQR
jgi:hypothetical protein